MSAIEPVSYAGECLLKISDVCERTSLGKSTIYDMVNAGTFPAPISVGPKTSRWMSSDLDKWFSSLKQRAA